MELHDVRHSDLLVQRGNRQHCMVMVEMQAGIVEREPERHFSGLVKYVSFFLISEQRRVGRLGGMISLLQVTSFSASQHRLLITF